MQNLVIALTGFIMLAAIFCAAGLLFSVPVWLLWNGCIVGTIAGVGPISWLQAWGILILCGFLFKSNTSKSS